MREKINQGGRGRRGWCRFGFWGTVGTIAAEAFYMYMNSRGKNRESMQLEEGQRQQCRVIEAPAPHEVSIAYLIDRSICTGCGICLSECRSSALYLEDGKAVINQEKCTQCNACYEVCTEGAVIQQVKRIKKR